MVRVGTPSAVARPDWYDRNPVQRAYAYAGVLSPHSRTDRFTYTVPAGKKAIVEFLETRIIRRGAATTPGIAYSTIFYTPSGGSETVLLEAELTDAQNAINDQCSFAPGITITLLAGDVITGATADISTGGNLYYRMTMKITEFDA